MKSVRVVIWNEEALGSSFEFGDRTERARVPARREVLGVCEATPEAVLEVLSAHFDPAPPLEAVEEAFASEAVPIGDECVGDACATIYLSLYDC